jgi:hypothetical protein
VHKILIYFTNKKIKGYSINAKLLATTLLAKMDRDSDGLVSQADYTYSLLSCLRNMNVTISSKVDDYLKSYFEIYTSSVQALTTKYGINDITLRENFIHILLIYSYD